MKKLLNWLSAITISSTGIGTVAACGDNANNLPSFNDITNKDITISPNGLNYLKNPNSGYVDSTSSAYIRWEIVNAVLNYNPSLYNINPRDILVQNKVNLPQSKTTKVIIRSKINSSNEVSLNVTVKPYVGTSDPNLLQNIHLYNFLQSIWTNFIEQSFGNKTFNEVSSQIRTLFLDDNSNLVNLIGGKSLYNFNMSVDKPDQPLGHTTVIKVTPTYNNQTETNYVLDVYLQNDSPNTINATGNNFSLNGVSATDLEKGTQIDISSSRRNALNLANSNNSSWKSNSFKAKFKSNSYPEQYKGFLTNLNTIFNTKYSNSKIDDKFTQLETANNDKFQNFNQLDSELKKANPSLDLKAVDWENVATTNNIDVSTNLLKLFQIIYNISYPLGSITSDPTYFSSILSGVNNVKASGNLVGTTNFSYFNMTQNISFYGSVWKNVSFAQNQYNLGFWSSNTNTSVIAHEFGHAIAQFSSTSDKVQPYFNNNPSAVYIPSDVGNANDWLLQSIANKIQINGQNSLGTENFLQSKLLVYSLVRSNYSRQTNYFYSNKKFAGFLNKGENNELFAEACTQFLYTPKAQRTIGWYILAEAFLNMNTII